MLSPTCLLSLFSELKLNLITADKWKCPRWIIKGVFGIASYRIIGATYIFFQFKCVYSEIVFGASA